MTTLRRLDMAVLYHNMGRYEKAEPLYQEAIAIQENIVGGQSPYYARDLFNLASLYTVMNRYEKAEPLYLKALSILGTGLGNENPLYALILQNLGSMYYSQGQYEKVEPLFLESKDICEKIVGKEHPQYANILHDLANVYSQREQYGKAEPLFLELSYANRRLLTKSCNILSELELNSYLNQFSEGQNLTLSFAQLTGSKNVAVACYDNSLFYKGFLLHNVGIIARLVQSDTSATEIFNRLKSYRRRLAAEYSNPIIERINVAELEEKANALEKELTRTVADYAEFSRQIKWQDVQKSLTLGEAAIEFVSFKKMLPKVTDSVSYAALLLMPGDSSPVFIPLCNEEVLSDMIKPSSVRKSDYVNSLYGEILGSGLYSMIWKPLEKPLIGVKTIYFSPSGLLHRLNLSAIKINEKETLSDHYHLVELGSTRQLIISPESNNTNTNSGQALLIGGVQYDLNSDSTASQNIDLESNITGTRGELNFSFTDSTDRGGSWNYLKWTDKEVTALEPILKSANIKPTVFKGYSATEEAFKSISVGQPSPRILHIATHGYFFPDPKETPKGSASGLGAEPVFKLSDHPMIRSGLILAGANQAWKTGKPFKPGMEDGILTAYEISQMDLSNTELVVLSACETGLGDIQGNEGVYGLQRAFKIAGAKYLIMSLWQVPDFQTQELMTVFYTNWLPSAAEAMVGKTEKMSIPDAFRAAQQTMREKYEHPHFWAGFVLVE